MNLRATATCLLLLLAPTPGFAAASEPTDPPPFSDLIAMEARSRAKACLCEELTNLPTADKEHLQQIRSKCVRVAIDKEAQFRRDADMSPTPAIFDSCRRNRMLIAARQGKPTDMDAFFEQVGDTVVQALINHGILDPNSGPQRDPATGRWK